MSSALAEDIDDGSRECPVVCKVKKKKRSGWLSKLVGVIAMVSFHPMSVTESLRIPVVSQHVSLTQTTCSALSESSPSFFATSMMSAPSRRLDQYWRWPPMTPNAAEDLRGMKVLDWQKESWSYPNEKGSPWAAIPRQPMEPHVHDVPLHMWFSERGMDFHLTWIDRVFDGNHHILSTMLWVK